VSPRTLQSRLAEENTQFARLLDLDQLVNGDASLGEIAFMLGFSDQSAFTRACKRRTAQSPTDYRREHGGGHAGT
jgi:AraC-like DNA-binding protein